MLLALNSHQEDLVKKKLKKQLMDSLVYNFDTEDLNEWSKGVEGYEEATDTIKEY